MKKVLDEPVYRINAQSELYRLYVESERLRKVVDAAMPNVFIEFPVFDNGILGIFSKSRMGIKIGSSAETEFETELKKEIASDYRILRKNSKTLKRLGNLIGKEIEEFNAAHSNYRFELLTRYGVNNVRGTHLIDGQLYVSLRNEPEQNSEELELIDYKEYLSLYIED